MGDVRENGRSECVVIAHGWRKRRGEWWVVKGKAEVCEGRVRRVCVLKKHSWWWEGKERMEV